MSAAGTSALGARPLLVLCHETAGTPSERLALIAEAARLGYEILPIARQERLAAIDRAAANLGADAIAVCGEAWMQASVAAVASGRDLPFGCIPAGRGDLLAEDMGADAPDAQQALGELAVAPERRVDLAEVNGVVFVNYVALGLSVAPARAAVAARRSRLRSGLRRARVSRARPSGLRADGLADGPIAPALLVSNNRFALQRHAIGARPRIDAGVLGLAILSADHDERSPAGGWLERCSTRLELAADGPVHADVDGLPRIFNPPLRFRVLPRALRARAPGLA